MRSFTTWPDDSTSLERRPQMTSHEAFFRVPGCVQTLPTSRGLASGVIVVSLVCLGSRGASGDERLQEVVQNVAANERLYENLELVIEERYRWIGPTDVGGYQSGVPAVVLDGEARYVYQRGLLYHHRHTREASSPNRSSMMGGPEYRRTRGGDASGVVHVESTYTLGYDGEQTRCVDKTSANVHQGRFAPRNLVQPHSLIFLDEPTLMRPLSEYLTAPHIGPHDTGHQMVHEGEDTIDGLHCVRLRSNQFYEKGKEPDFLLLWLSVERNYLPVRMECYVVSYSSKIPLAISTVSDLRELAPGVWCPFVQTRIKNYEIAASKGQTVVLTRTDNTVTKAVLDPEYDISLFRDIPIPAGMPVIEFKEQQKVRDYVHGSPAPPAARSWWWWIAAAVFGCVLLGALWRKRYDIRLLRR